jgi:predicted esterase
MFLAADPLHAAIKEIDLQSSKCSSDYRSAVNSLKNDCIRLVTPDPLTTQSDELVIYLHGDYGIGGSSYMSTMVASHFPKPNRMNIALIRPGYFDDEGNFSTGNSLGVINSFKYTGRLDNYTRDNVDIIADAILNLKKHYKSKRVLIIGHSGGAAIASLILNFYPQLTDGALLINCPCDLKHWRPDWEQSLSPIEHIDHISPKVPVRIISGAEDDAVFPELGKNYTQQLIKNHKNAKFYLGIGMKHNMSDQGTREIALKSIEKFLEEASQP